VCFDEDARMDNKRSYETPALQFEGTVKDLTLGSKTGTFTDKLFPPHTPKSKLTFSKT
jgi:hypothetical protein